MLQIKILFCISVLVLTTGYVSGTVIDFNEFVQAIPLQFFNNPQFQKVLNEVELGREEIVHQKIERHYDIADKFDRFNNETFPLLETETFGPIRGKTLKSYFQRPFFAFQGIPYAETPQRFQTSVLKDGNITPQDEEEYDATYLRPKCPQLSMLTNGISGREDCLHLSIYTPNTVLDDSVEYPVMIFIHGGSYMTGDASLYVPTKLMDKDVIVVVIQYRLGTLGFLAAGTEDAPGNMGLMDQIIALRWVRAHIREFGGDVSKITVFGQSAGASSASLLMLSPLTGDDYNSEDLFQRIIAESGSAIDVWTLDPNPQDSLRLHGEAVGCTGSNDEIVDCMITTDLDVIVNGYNKVSRENRANGGLGFAGLCPVVQNGIYFQISPDITVIAEHPLITAESGNYRHVSIMTGSVRDEGSLVAGLAWESFFNPKNLTYNEEFMSVGVIPFFVNVFGITDITGTVSNSIRLAFLRDAEMGNWDSMIGGLIDAFGMMFLKTGGWTLASLISNRSPKTDIYFYSFEFESNDSLFPWYFMSEPDIPMEGGITHADELLYLFHLPSYLNDDPNQVETIKRLTTLWANFARYGDPTPSGLTMPGEIWEDLVDEWMPFTYVNQKFMLIQDECTMSADYTLRWNHFSMGEEVTVEEEDHEVNIALDAEESTQTEESSSKDSFRTAAIALGVTSSVLMLVVVVLAFKSFSS